MAIRDAVQKAALSYRRYGYRRITELVRRSGIAVGEWVVRRILRTDNLLAVRKRKFVITTDSKHRFAVLRIPGDVNGAFRKNVNKDSEDVNKDSDGK